MECISDVGSPTEALNKREILVLKSFGTRLIFQQVVSIGGIDGNQDPKWIKKDQLMHLRHLLLGVM